MRPRTRERLRLAVLERAGARLDVDGYNPIFTRCAYCGLTVLAYFAIDSQPAFYTIAGEKIHLDHVIPESRNGPTSLDNTVIACTPCNFAKRDKSFGDPRFQAWLQHRRLEVWLSQLPGLVAERIEGVLEEMERDLESVGDESP